MEDRRQCLEEHRDDFRKGRKSFPQAPTNTAVRGGGGKQTSFEKKLIRGEAQKKAPT